MDCHGPMFQKVNTWERKVAFYKKNAKKILNIISHGKFKMGMCRKRQIGIRKRTCSRGRRRKQLRIRIHWTWTSLYFIVTYL